MLRRSTYLLLLILFVASSLKAQNQPCPCCTGEARQFDFWLGNWKVYTPDGKLAGENKIIILQDSCVIQENWTSNASGFTGTSYNFYNPGTKKWQQLWLDNQGGNLQLEGHFNDGKMILKTNQLLNREGKMQIDRITWTPNKDGTVRQHWEATTDNGKTWTTVFDGLYKKVP